MSGWIDVAPASEFLPGTWRSLDLDGTMVAVFNLDGDFYAIEDVCTHDGGILSGGTVERDEIVCPRHGAHFSIKTGQALTPPAYQDVATFPVRVQVGVVQVRDPRWD
jgi:3-phenylpropionate/trans-cinnamate dioxygenase ferredoxin subunit